VAAYPASDQDDLYGMADVDDRCPKPIRVRPGAADWVFAPGYLPVVAVAAGDL
jgi:hypothetical protein